MNFFKSVFSADSDSSDHSPRDHEEAEDGQDQEEESSENPDPYSQSAWGLGDLIKTITTKSESVIQTYRRDLEEFGSELKKETSVFKDVAARAVLVLPGSLEVGASVAQESLESVGQAIDDFGGSVWRGTAEIISHGKDALFTADSDLNLQNSIDPQNFSSSSTKRYSRFEVQILTIQNDEKTFVEEVEDVEDFEKWRGGFRLEEEEEEIEGLLYENGTLEEFYVRIVPDVVDRETFWSRYFYRVYKLKQAEDARAKLVKRVISGEEEEELTWEVDDEDENEEQTKREIQEAKEEKKEEEEKTNEEKKPTEEEATAGEEIVEVLEKPKEEEVKMEVMESLGIVDQTPQVEKVEVDGDFTSKIDDKAPLEPKSETGESSKGSDFSIVSSQPSMQEDDDLEWDEIEDLGEHEDKKVGLSGENPKPVDLRKRLSAAEDDEDLSWDIEDDDVEPAKP